jgi:hypothetical protein
MFGRIRPVAGQRVRRTCVGLLAACAVVLGSSATASATTLSYSFDSDNQDWGVSQDASSGNAFQAQWTATGGNPSGHLFARDTGPETGCAASEDPCELLTFYSPSVTPLVANYNGLASFDLRTSADPGDINSAAELILLAAGDFYLDGVLPSPLSTAYSHFSIPLNEGANWSICPFSGGSCSQPTQAQFKTLIGATDQIAIMADIASPETDGTGETYDLDNVILTDGPPTPPVTPTQPKKKCKKNERRAASAAKKKCKKKRRDDKVKG